MVAPIWLSSSDIVKVKVISKLFSIFFLFLCTLVRYSFLRASAMLKHVIAIGLTSVCPSVRPSVRHTLAPYQNG